MNNTKSGTKAVTLRLCAAALFMALNILMSSFGIPVPGGHLYMNDMIICTAALLFSPAYAFCIGGVGAFLGDLLFYPAPMFVSLLTHGLQAVVISATFKAFKKHRLSGAIIGLLLGAIIMVVGYSLGRTYVYSTPEYALLKLPYQIAQAMCGVIFALIVNFKTPLPKLFKKYGF